MFISLLAENLYVTTISQFFSVRGQILTRLLGDFEGLWKYFFLSEILQRSSIHNCDRKFFFEFYNLVDENCFKHFKIDVQFFAILKNSDCRAWVVRSPNWVKYARMHGNVYLLQLDTASSDNCLVIKKIHYNTIAWKWVLKLRLISYEITFSKCCLQ